MITDELRRKLRKLSDATDKILKEREEQGAPIDAVNVADLYCASVGIEIASELLHPWINLDDGGVLWSVVVAEAAPDAREFQLWLTGELHKLGYDVVVRTEW
jgi:hypothetical protein